MFFFYVNYYAILVLRFHLGWIRRSRSSSINSAHSFVASWYVQENESVFPLQTSRIVQITATPKLPQPSGDPVTAEGWSSSGTINLVMSHQPKGLNLSLPVAWEMILIILFGFCLSSSGIGQWYPSLKNTVLFFIEKIASPQWHEFM